MALVFEDCISVALRLSFAPCQPGESYRLPLSTPTVGTHASAQTTEKYSPNGGIGMPSVPIGSHG